MKKEKNTKATVSIWFVCLSIMFVGFLLIILTSIDIQNAAWLWENIFRKILSVLGTTLFSAGLVSIVLEISDIKDTISRAINKIIQGDFSFEGYSEEKLMEANERIALARLGLKQDEHSLKNSVYQLYEPLILQSHKGIYYKYHNASFMIEPLMDKAMFKILVECNYEIINKYGLENKMNFKLKSYSTEGMEYDFKLLDFEVNNKKEMIFIEKESLENGIYYDQKIRLHYDFKKSKDTKIYLKYEYYTPIFDVRQSYKLTYPCRHLEHKIYMRNNKKSDMKWRVEATAFSPYYISQKNIDDTVRVEQEVEESVKIKMTDWVLPGAGYVTMYIQRDK